MKKGITGGLSFSTTKNGKQRLLLTTHSEYICTAFFLVRCFLDNLLTCLRKISGVCT
jgi:hypothetical protein